MVDIQVTLLCKTGQYKPISTVVKNIESIEWYNEHKQEVQRTAIQQISNQRQLTWNELKRQGFTQCKARVYEPAKWAMIKRIEKQVNKRGLNK